MSSKVEKLVDEIKLWRIDDDGTLRLKFHEGQAAAWKSTWEDAVRFTFMFAGTQGGKTSFGPWWLWKAITTFGKGDYLAVTASYDLFKLKMLPELRTVFEHVIGWRDDGVARGRYWSGGRVIELRDPATNEFWAKRSDDPMWGRIILRSAASPGGLEAATANAAWLDECGMDTFGVEDWEAVQRRLSLSQGPVLGTTTLYNVGWTKTEIQDQFEAGDSDFRVVQYSSHINPAFPRVEYDRAKKRLPGWRFSMFYDGLFSRPATLIYGCWKDGYVVQPGKFPSHWRRGIGVDFGGANVAILWAAEEPSTDEHESVWHIYGEWLGGGDTTAAYVKRARDGLIGARTFLTGGGAKSESQQRRDWKAAGLRIDEPPISDLEGGISNVVGYIKTGRIRVWDTCTGLRDELGTYQRKLDKDGQVTDEIVSKRSYHRLDALRYLLARIEGKIKRQAKSMRG